MVTLRLLKPPPWGGRDGGFVEDAGLAQGLYGFWGNTCGMALEVNLFADLDDMGFYLSAGFGEDMHAGGHDFGADTIPVRDSNGYFGHIAGKLRKIAGLSGRAPRQGRLDALGGLFAGERGLRSACSLRNVALRKPLGKRGGRVDLGQFLRAD